MLIHYTKYNPKYFRFNYPQRSMLLEPLLLVAAFFLMYLMAIIYVRLDFSITLDEGAETKMKVQ